VASIFVLDASLRERQPIICGGARVRVLFVIDDGEHGRFGILG
jgi:hypothetical protein